MPVHPTGTRMERQAPITGRKSINSDAAFAGMSMARMARIFGIANVPNVNVASPACRLFNEARQTTALGAGQVRVPDRGENACGTRRCARVLRWMHDNQKLPAPVWLDFRDNYHCIKHHHGGRDRQVLDGSGFAGFIAFGAWRSLGGIFFAKANHLSTQYMAVFAVTIFAMAILCYRFTSKKFLLRPLDRASIVIARHMLAGILLSRE
jgi:hypothetical protein